MAYESPYNLARKLETDFTNRLSGIDLYSLEQNERKAIMSLRNEMTDARIDIRDYELSETRDEQLHNAKEAKKRLNRVHKHMLAVSEYNVFGAADVAQFGAQVEHIKARLL